MSGQLRGSRAIHHAWVYVKEHNRVCRKCGCRKVNIDKGGRWVAEWHRPDGTVVELALAPACEVGPETATRLAWLASWERERAGAVNEGAPA